MGSNPIHHPSPAKKTKSLLLDYVQLLMIGQAGQWTQTPSATSLQPENEMLVLDYVQLLIISLAGWWAHTPSATPLQPAKWNAHLWITFNFWWSALAGRWTQTLCNTPLQPKYPSPARKMECSFLDYFQLLLISQAGWWAHTPSATPLQPGKWNAHFKIMFTSDDQLGWLMDSNPICHPSPAKKWNAHFCIMFNFWWLAGLVIWTWMPSVTPLQPKNIEMLMLLDYVQLLIISLAGQWTQTPCCHPSPARKMKCSFLDYVQLLMIGWAGW